MRVRIGTSGYNYPAWKGTFYPEKMPAKEMLSFYAGVFDSVEINYSFYRLPSEKMIAAWAAGTPAGFRFAVKAWQRITHHKRLAGASADAATFADTVRGLGEKLGPLLYQLPPNLKKDVRRLHQFLEDLPADLRAAFEFRHLSWFDDEVFDLLRANRAALCVADGDELETPLVRTATHGFFRLRRERYTPAELAGWAERILAAGFTDDVYVFFKHEDSAQGTAYARTLRELLASRH